MLVIVDPPAFSLLSPLNLSLPLPLPLLFGSVCFPTSSLGSPLSVNLPKSVFLRQFIPRPPCVRLYVVSLFLQDASAPETPLVQPWQSANSFALQVHLQTGQCVSSISYMMYSGSWSIFAQRLNIESDDRATKLVLLSGTFRPQYQDIWTWL